MAAAPEGRRDPAGEGAAVIVKAGFAEHRRRPAAAQVGQDAIAAQLGGEGEAADAPAGGHRQDLAEGAVEPAPADRQTLAVAGIFARRHRLPAQEQVVQPRRRREAGLEGGVEHGETLVEQALGVVQGQVLEVALGADPDPLAEHPLEMGRAEADRRGDLLERGLLAAPRLDIAQRRGHQVIVELSGIRCDVHRAAPCWRDHAIHSSPAGFRGHPLLAPHSQLQME